MPSGGHARSGPAPDPHAIRNDRGGTAQWSMLPIRCDTPAPDWPLAEFSEAETTMWFDTWTLPQADQWRANRLERQVALYVRTYLAAAQGRDPSKFLTAARQQEYELGLSLSGLVKHRWRIATGEPATPEVKRPNDSRRTSAKARFESLQGGRTA